MRLAAEVEKLAHVAELLVAGVEEFLDALVGEDEELALERVAKNLCGGIVVAMGAAVGFGDDFIDDAQFFKIRGHDLHGDCGGFRPFWKSPHDGWANLPWGLRKKKPFLGVFAGARHEKQSRRASALRR